jgi:hypothetical protein
MPDAIVINGRRTPTTVQRRRDGDGLLVRQGHRYVVFDAAELDQLLAFVRDEPELGKLARFPAKTAAPPSDELNWIE